MIRRSFALLSALTCVALAPVSSASAQESRPSEEFLDESERYSGEQLDNLVSAIALYPDALLAQVLVAATFPDQVTEAARYVRQHGTADIDDQSWDVSVKSVAHYPSALNMMAEKEDWTAALGRAYALQSGDVMAAVQRLRAMADAQGNLRTTEQQVVTRDDDAYVIAPAQPRVIYVPVYDPYVVYRRPIFATAGYYTPFWSFGIGFPIGAWLSYDLNWRSRSVYYNGWDAAYYGWAGGWRARSRPFIRITNVYVSPRYRSVYVNREVVRRRVVYRNVDRYVGVHRETRFSRDDFRGRDRVERPRTDFRNDSRYGTVDRSRTGSRYGADARGGTDRRDGRSGSDAVRGGSVGGGYGGTFGGDRGGRVGNGTGRTDDRREASPQRESGAGTGGWNVDRTRGGSMNRGDVNRGDMNRGDVNRGDVNRGDVNRRDMNRGDVNRGDVTAVT